MSNSGEPADGDELRGRSGSDGSSNMPAPESRDNAALPMRAPDPPQSTPEGFSSGDMPGEGPANGRRRGPDTTSTASLLLPVPWYFWSLGVLYLFAGFFVDQPWEWVVIGIWLLSAAVMLWQPAEDIVARVLLRRRRPTVRESQKLDAAWRAVSQKAGVDASKYSLWVEEVDSVNAFAFGSRTVSVTRWALSALPPRQLEGILAHELGHQLGPHGWSRGVGFWYSLPARAAVRVLRAIGGAMQRMPVFGCLVAFFIGFCVLGMLLGALLFGYFPLQLFAVILALASPVILAWFDRLGEKNADKVAASLGYGPVILEALYRRQAQSLEADRDASGRRAALLSSHPSIADSIRSLENHLSQRAA
jgi:Zn-dependent protease with chaperone function